MRSRLRASVFLGLALTALLFGPGVVRGQDTLAAPPAATINGADTAFVLMAAALVMIMTPGLGLFYGGMVRRKNVLATFQQSFIMLGLITVQWVLFGYSLAFGPNKLNGFIGGLEWFGLNGVGLDPNPDYSATIPHQAFMVFQLMFAIITPALISGAFAERMKFSAYLLFTLLWATFVYDPVAHWVWGTGGWIRVHLGAFDFAGGLVVHLISGIAALCCVLVMGKRKGLGSEEMHPHNLTMTALGTALLWFGWFGFNAGSALAANRSAVAAFVNTNTAAAVAAIRLVADRVGAQGQGDHPRGLHRGRRRAGGDHALRRVRHPDGCRRLSASWSASSATARSCSRASSATTTRSTSSASTAWAGPSAPWPSACWPRPASRATSTASSMATRPSSATRPSRWSRPGSYSFVVTFVILKLVDLVVGLRVTTDEEEAGLDLTQHGERGYMLGIDLAGSRPYGGTAPAFGAPITAEVPAATRVLS